jgi:hypothetical protein
MDVDAPGAVTTHADARLALSLALDGREPFSHAIADAAYSVATRLVAARQRRALGALRAAKPGVVCLVGDGVDRLERMLASLGAPGLRCPHWAALPPRARVALIGCPLRSEAHDPQRVRDFMQAGGVLVSSDHAASLPALRPLLAVAERGAPRRARALRPEGNDQLLPAVYLPAGYDRLAPLGPDASARALATDALTGDPLVVCVPWGAGALLHAVPHWFQDDPACMTDVERRPAQSVAEYAAGGVTRADLTVGDVRAAATMLDLLLAGLEQTWLTTSS